MSRNKKLDFRTNKPFDVKVCDALRQHVGVRKSLESRRTNTFKDRDAALAELAGFRNKHSDEAVKAKERHSDAVIEIASLDKLIKWRASKIDELVEKADEPEFNFMLEPDEDEVSIWPKKKPSEKDKEADGSKGQLKLTEDPRPVGRPRKGAPSAKPEADGVDEHLAASVNDLDLMPGNLGKQLIDAGLETVGQVIAAIEKGELEKLTGLKSHYADEIEKAIHKFRRSHRRAAREVEGAAS